MRATHGVPCWSARESFVEPQIMTHVLQKSWLTQSCMRLKQLITEKGLGTGISYDEIMFYCVEYALNRSITLYIPTSQFGVHHLHGCGTQQCVHALETLFLCGSDVVYQ